MKMSNKKRNADKKPLMYIVQPDYAETSSSMQEIVIKKKNRLAPTPEPESEHSFTDEEKETKKQKAETVQKARELPDESLQQQDRLYAIEKQKEHLMKISEGNQRKTVGKEEDQIQKLTSKKQENKQQTSNSTDDQAHHKKSETTPEVSAHKKETPETNRADSLIKSDDKNITVPKTEPEHPEKKPEAVHNIKADEKAIPHKRIKKPMSKMSIQEKIDFLTKLPHNMPRALCLIEANGKTYRGVIVGRRNNSVLVRTTGNGAPTELFIDHITSLHPLGF
ncbi:CotO family spore coat protein [Bacillus vallismortis]|uniref:CotO family spore coat protein n=1 Tax=Bacillus vallismortis TaxID=72361 RepID=UPI0015D5626B